MFTIIVFTQLQYFTSTTLSSFYLDVIKDSLYSDAEKSLQRRSIQTVLFHVSGLCLFLQVSLSCTLGFMAEKVMPPDIQFLAMLDRL